MKADSVHMGTLTKGQLRQTMGTHSPRKDMWLYVLSNVLRRYPTLLKYVPGDILPYGTVSGGQLGGGGGGGGVSCDTITTVSTKANEVLGHSIVAVPKFRLWLATTGARSYCGT